MLNKVDTSKIEVNTKLKIELFIAVLLVIILLMLSIFFVKTGIKSKEKYDFVYQENIEADYKVYLKENDYFDEPYLPAGGQYISSLIDKIAVNFGYQLKTDDYVKGNYSYSIVATLEAREKGSDVVIWSKDETLYDSEESDFANVNSYDFATQLDVDYNKFNMTMNDFRRAYGISIDGQLIISLVVNSKFEHEKSNETIPSIRKSSIIIPLMEQTTSIEMDYDPKSVTTDTIVMENRGIVHYLLIISGIILLLCSCYFGYALVITSYQIWNKESKYKRKIRKIFDNYDQIIVQIDTFPDISGKDVLKVRNFDEVLDAQMGLQQPILYYESKTRNESSFMIIDGNRVFMYEIKESDFRSSRGYYGTKKKK